MARVENGGSHTNPITTGPRMAKRKPNRRLPQAQHGKKSTPSQHDKRKRLTARNLQRRQTTAALVPLRGVMNDLATHLAKMLDKRIAFRLPIVIAGMLLAGGRRTAAAWFRAAGVKDDWDRFYDLLSTVGREAKLLMLPLVISICKRFDPGPDGAWVLVLDDSPTKRFGRHVEAANIHHNPTSGPGDGPWLYGHNWVCLAMIMSHPLFGSIALPLLSSLYVRKIDVSALKIRYPAWEFRTKHQLALDLCRELMRTLRGLRSLAKFVVVFDGAYAAKALVQPLLSEGATIVTRLRSDAKLFDVPVAKQVTRGRPRKYGKNRLSLKTRAGRRDGWESLTYACRGIDTTRRYKSFLATSHVFGGVVRIVLLEYTKGNWATYASSDVSMSVEAILKIVADRWSIEEHFKDVKELWGAGQQQVRNLFSSIGCWQLCSWLYTMVELECWDQPIADLVDRSNRPWDNPNRRPSHADRRRRIVQAMLRETFLNDLQNITDPEKICDRLDQLLALAA